MNVGAGSLRGALCTTGPWEPRTVSSLFETVYMPTPIRMALAIKIAPSMHQLLVRCFGPMVTVEQP